MRKLKLKLKSKPEHMLMRKRKLKFKPEHMFMLTPKDMCMLMLTPRPRSTWLILRHFELP